MLDEDGTVDWTSVGNGDVGIDAGKLDGFGDGAESEVIDGMNDRVYDGLRLDIIEGFDDS